MCRRSVGSEHVGGYRRGEDVKKSALGELSRLETQELSRCSRVMAECSAQWSKAHASNVGSTSIQRKMEPKNEIQTLERDETLSQKKRWSCQEKYSLHRSASWITPEFQATVERKRALSAL